VQNIERDRREPRRAVLRRIAEALGTDVESLNQTLTPARMTPEQVEERRAYLLAALAELDNLEQEREIS